MSSAPWWKGTALGDLAETMARSDVAMKATMEAAREINPRRTRYEPNNREWWVRCDAGHEHYGEHGAAGLLVAWRGLYLVQERAAWVDHGGTMSIPSGALHADEDVRVGALREAAEEGVKVVLDQTGGAPIVFTSDHGGWAFHTVLVHVTAEPKITASAEATGHEWATLRQITEMGLHPGFRAFIDEHWGHL